MKTKEERLLGFVKDWMSDEFINYREEEYVLIFGNKVINIRRSTEKYIGGTVLNTIYELADKNGLSMSLEAIEGVIDIQIT